MRPNLRPPAGGSRPSAARVSSVVDWPARGLVAGLRLYRLLLSPWLGNACRFEPTCSRYAIEAVETHGALVGSGLALARLGRCHPWCAGGHDPVPPRGWLGRSRRERTPAPLGDDRPVAACPCPAEPPALTTRSPEPKTAP